MSRLITKENHLLIAPSIACAIGLNESIILQQVHYWLNARTNQNFYDNKYWVYNTYEQWLKQFPFWSEITIKRIIISLEQKGLIISANFNKNKFNRTKWYSINYDVLNNLEYNINQSDQNDTTIVSKRSVVRIKMIRSNIETEITTEITNNSHLEDKAKSVNNNHILNKKERDKKIFKIWNEEIEEGKEEVIKATRERIRLVNLRLHQYFDNDILLWKEFCQKITSSKFLMGEITAFKVNFDWALKEENLLKIVENNYNIGDRVVRHKKSNNKEIEEFDSNPIWETTRGSLKKQLGEGTYNSWIKKLKFQAISDQVVYFTAPTKFIKEWIITHYSENIKRYLNFSGANIKEIFIQVI